LASTWVSACAGAAPIVPKACVPVRYCTRSDGAFVVAGTLLVFVVAAASERCATLLVSGPNFGVIGFMMLPATMPPPRPMTMAAMMVPAPTK
jgi:hypothetical protein